MCFQSFPHVLFSQAVYLPKIQRKKSKVYQILELFLLWLEWGLETGLLIPTVVTPEVSICRFGLRSMLSMQKLVQQGLDRWYQVTVSLSLLLIPLTLCTSVCALFNLSVTLIWCCNRLITKLLHETWHLLCWNQHLWTDLSSKTPENVQYWQIYCVLVPQVCIQTVI